MLIESTPKYGNPSQTRARVTYVTIPGEHEWAAGELTRTSGDVKGN